MGAHRRALRAVRTRATAQSYPNLPPATSVQVLAPATHGCQPAGDLQHFPVVRRQRGTHSGAPPTLCLDPDGADALGKSGSLASSPPQCYRPEVGEGFLIVSGRCRVVGSVHSSEAEIVQRDCGPVGVVYLTSTGARTAASLGSTSIRRVKGESGRAGRSGTKSDSPGSARLFAAPPTTRKATVAAVLLAR